MTRSRAQVEKALHEAVRLEADLRSMSRRLNDLTEQLFATGLTEGGDNGTSDPPRAP